ncbi:MAG: glycosyltransferase family 2 protein [Roseobacter sp.]
MNVKMAMPSSKRSISKIALAVLAVAFFPISIPLVVLNKIKRQKRKALMEAFTALHGDGIEAGLRILKKNSKVVPPGVKHLFKAVFCETDSTWETETNAWLCHETTINIRLKSGGEPRFYRIAFEDVPKVDRPEKITILMAAYNSENTICPAVQSILNQSWKNIELIVVNDMSTDRTGDLLDDMARGDTRMTVLHNTVNVGPYVCRNLALSIATGDFVTGHDADDLALPNRLERQVVAMLDSDEIDAVIGQMVRFNENGELSFASIIHRNSYDGLHRLAMISLMIRRETLSRFGYWDSVRFGADSELFARLRTNIGGRVKVTRVLTMLCLDSEGSLTNHAEYGIKKAGGTSQIRQEYSELWQGWHETCAGKVPYREFSNAERPFGAPEKMLVPKEDIDALRSQIGER